MMTARARVDDPLFVAIAEFSGVVRLESRKKTLDFQLRQSAAAAARGRKAFRMTDAALHYY